MSQMIRVLTAAASLAVKRGGEPGEAPQAELRVVCTLCPCLGASERVYRICERFSQSARVFPNLAVFFPTCPCFAQTAFY